MAASSTTSATSLRRCQARRWRMAPLPSAAMRASSSRTISASPTAVRAGSIRSTRFPRSRTAGSGPWVSVRSIPCPSRPSLRGLPLRRLQRVRRQRQRRRIALLVVHRSHHRRPHQHGQQDRLGDAWRARLRRAPRWSGSWPTGGRPNRPCRRPSWRPRPASSRPPRRTRRPNRSAAEDRHWATAPTARCASWRTRCRRCGRSPSSPSARATSGSHGRSRLPTRTANSRVGTATCTWQPHMPCSWAIIPNLSAISRYRGLSVIGKSCGTVGGSPTASSRAPAASAASEATRRSLIISARRSALEAITSDVVSTWQLVSSSSSSTPRALACSATARLQRDRLAAARIDEQEFLLDAERGMSGHGLKIRSGPSAVLTTGRIGDVGSFAGRCAPRGPASSIPAPRRNQTCQFEPRPRLVSMAKDFRFGLGLQAARRQQSVQDWARRAEEHGLRRGAPARPPLYDGALPDVDGRCDGDRDAAGRDVRPQRGLLQTRPAGARRLLAARPQRRTLRTGTRRRLRRRRSSSRPNCRSRPRDSASTICATSPSTWASTSRTYRCSSRATATGCSPSPRNGPTSSG